MKYQGSKRRIAKHILPIILAGRTKNQNVYDLFCGGGNMLDMIPLSEGFGEVYGIDSDIYAIEALKLIQNNPTVLPKNGLCTDEETYQHFKQCDDVDPGMKGYYGYALSYGGKWFGGCRRDKSGERDYIDEAYRAALKQFKALRGKHLFCCDYKAIQPLKKSIVYMDPPYKKTTSYRRKVVRFNHDEMWQYARDLTRDRHCSVFVSEYQAPEDFECIWHKEISSSLTQNTGSKKGIEKLFKLRDEPR